MYIERNRVPEDLLDPLAQEVEFDESIEGLGEEIKDSWWQQNKARLLRDEV
jgi:hypothetical protein